MIGDGRLCPAALIFLSESAEAIESEEQQQQMVWTAVRDVNRNGPAHAQIRKDMIRVQSSAHSSRLEKSSKGTIMRGRVMTEFSAEIESLYADPVQTMKDGRRLEAEPLDTILKVVSDIVSAHLQVEHVSPDTDLYHEGVSSSGCMQIRNQLRLQLSTGAAAKMSPNVVYESGSIRGLAVYIRELAHFVQGSQTGGNGDFKMMQMAQKHVAGQLRMLEEMQAAGHVILLTGATGSLGVHLLDQLLDTRGVEQIVLLIRAPHDHRIANSSEACRQRVESVLREHGMAPLGRKCAPVVICFPAELDSSTLGLSTSDRDRLMEKVTHIIHAAWAVNFNLPLKTFEANIAGVVNLYNLARLAGKRQRRAVSYVFCSSVASVMNAGGVGQPGDGDHSTAVGIKETTSDRPSDASSLGYSQSKWVAERILADLPNAATVPKDLKEQFPFPHHGYVSISILRIGQLCGDTYRSAWNMREAWPLMLDVGLRVMPLPQIPDLNAASLGILGWLPVNLAARAVLEISIGQFGRRRPEGGNLEIFHLVSTDERTDWAMAQNWLATMEFKDRKTEGLETGAPRGKVQIVPATQWLEELESLAVDHPAKNLLGLWTEGWTAGSPSAVAAAEGSGTGADREDARPVVRFETERAREASETMRDGEGMRVDKDRFEGMVRWVLAEGRRLGFGSGKE